MVEEILENNALYPNGTNSISAVGTQISKTINTPSETEETPLSAVVSQAAFSSPIQSAVQSVPQVEPTYTAPQAKPEPVHEAPTYTAPQAKPEPVHEAPAYTAPQAKPEPVHEAPAYTAPQAKPEPVHEAPTYTTPQAKPEPAHEAPTYAAPQAEPEPVHETPAYTAPQAEAEPVREAPQVSATPQTKNMLRCWADALTNMTVFNGRTTRYEFWSFQSVSLVIFLLMAFVGYYLSQPKMVLDIFAVYFLLPAASSCTRRLHDISMSGWWTAPAVALALTTLVCWNFDVHNMILLLFATLTYISYLFGLLREPGTPENNAYGKATNEAEIYYIESRAFISFMTTFIAGLWIIYIAYLLKF